MPRKTNFLRAILTLAACLAAFSATAQTPNPPAGEFGDQISVNEVLLDVLVTDKAGTAIVGLDAEDFVVEEDGEPVDLTGVTFYSTSRFVGGENEASSMRLDLNPVDRYFVLFFHNPPGAEIDISRRSTQLLDAARKAKRWVREEALPTDWIAVASYDVKLKIHQDFTHDRGGLVRAIGDAVTRKDPSKQDWPSRRAAAGDGESASEGRSLLAALPRGKELRRQTGTIYDGLSRLSEAAGATVGRKNLILFSTGFGDINTFGQYVPDTRYYEPMRHVLNDNNVAVYPLDLTPTNVSHTMSDALNQLAGDTGGRYFFSFTSFITPLKEVGKINNGYYLLSYRSRRPASESGYQKVRIKAVNPQFKVKAREGYLFGNPESGKKS